MEDMQHFVLNPVLDLAEVDYVTEQMKSIGSACQAISIDASKVVRVSTPAIQMLLAIENHCRNNDIKFEITSTADCLKNAVEALGLAPKFSQMLQQAAT